ncbi:cytochrome P450 [Aquisediminimonas profunda]|uniref:cytochrome P450 n=1 Tax=Aquisediminimonas profunda TaxID=1550733 RepID=UPI001C6343CD|nr:cytochrome P450 [Aquisediminimonas profunda]
MDTWDIQADWRAQQATPDGAIFPVYESRRATCPVQRVALAPGKEAWVVIGQSEVEQVLLDTETFSSAQYLFGPELTIPIELDPPVHSHFRRILNQLINARTASALEPRVRQHAIRLLTPFVAAGGGDLRPIAEELTLKVLCDLLGISDAEWEMIHETQKGLVASEIAVTDDEMVSNRFAALKPVMDYAQNLIDLRRANPSEDFVSGLLDAKVEGRSLTNSEIIQIMVLILMAGHETTRTAIEGSTLLLAQHPEEQARLRADPALLRNAIEECLRIESPVQALNRKTTTEVSLAGVTIAAGAQVMPAYGAANFDEGAFRCPADFQIDRSANRHFAFGRGIHTCLGAPIARMELRVFFEEFLRMTKSFSVSGNVQRADWPDSTLCRLDVQLVPSEW